MLMLCIIMLTGCAAEQGQRVVQLPSRTYAPRASAALAFEPPATSQWPAEAFVRAGRESSAFMGYESQITDYYYSRTSDRQHSGQPDRVDRDSFSTRTSVTTR